MQVSSKPAKLPMHAGLECGVIGEKYPGLPDGILWPDDRRSAQPERASADFVCGEFLELS
jgi:hypothetical protein